MIQIMVVDDELDFVALMKKILRKAGYEVITAYGAVEMVKKLQTTVPNLIFLDVMMPEVDGWMATELLKSDKKFKDIPICILTARTRTEDAVTSLEKAGANWHLNKPITVKQVLDAVEMILSGKTDS